MKPIIRRTANGHWLAEVNHAYRRIRKTFPTRGDAEAWADATVLALHNQSAPLSALDQRDARNALNLLPDGVTLTDAARAWLREHPAHQAIPLSEAITAFLEEKEHLNLRPRSLSSVRAYLLRFERDFSGCTLDTLTPALLSDWLNRLTGPITRNNYRRALTDFGNFCVRHQWLTRNPAAATSAAHVEPAMPAILTITQTRDLLRAVIKHPSVAPYYALALFAGLRPTELERLNARDIQDQIHITAAAAKTRQQRYVTISENLRAWLDLYLRPGPVTPPGFRALFERIRTDAGIDWTPDLMRHSFATYHLALHRDAALTAHELGHRGQHMLFQHYRNLATHEDSVAYFSLTPTNLHEAKKP